MRSDLAWPATLEYRTCPEELWIYTVSFTEEKYFSSLLDASNSKHLLSYEGEFVTTAAPQCWNPVWLELVQLLCMLSQSMCVHAIMVCACARCHSPCVCTPSWSVCVHAITDHAWRGCSQSMHVHAVTVRASACCHSCLCVCTMSRFVIHMCITPIVSRTAASLEPSTTSVSNNISPPLSHRFLSLKGRCVVKKSHSSE